MLQNRDRVDLIRADWQRIYQDLDLDDLGVTLRVIRAGRILETRLEETASEHGFKARGDFEVLATLRRSHPAPVQPAQLAESVMISTSGMTGRLDRLEEAGYIERRPHPSDRRALEVYITASGIETADRVFTERLKVESDALGDVSASEKHELAKMLRLVLTQLGDGVDGS